MNKQTSKTTSYGVVDTGGELSLKAEKTAGSDQMPEELRRAPEGSGQQDTVERMIGSARSRFRPYATEAEARAALVAQTIKGYFVLPPDFVQKGGVEAYGPDAVRLSNQDRRAAFEDLLRQHQLAGRVDGHT